MKGFALFVVWMLTGFWSLNAMSQTAVQGFYLGAGGGGVEYNGFNNLCRDITGALPGTNVPTDCESSETAVGWKAFGGWRWNPYLAIEGGYADLGKADGDTIIFGQDVNGEISSSALFAELVGSFPLSQRLLLFGKIGVASLDTELKTDVFAVPLTGGSDSSFSRDDTEAVYGLGLEFGFSPRLSGRAEWERFDFEDGIDFYSASLVFYPGR